MPRSENPLLFNKDRSQGWVAIAQTAANPIPVKIFSASGQSWAQAARSPGGVSAAKRCNQAVPSRSGEAKRDARVTPSAPSKESEAGRPNQ